MSREADGMGAVLCDQRIVVESFEDGGQDASGREMTVDLVSGEDTMASVKGEEVEEPNGRRKLSDSEKKQRRAAYLEFVMTLPRTMSPTLARMLESGGDTPARGRRGAAKPSLNYGGFVAPELLSSPMQRSISSPSKLCDLISESDAEEVSDAGSSMPGPSVEFNWSIDQIAIMDPKDFSIHSPPYSWHSEQDALEAMGYFKSHDEHFFKQDLIAPSPAMSGPNRCSGPPSDFDWDNQSFFGFTSSPLPPSKLKLFSPPLFPGSASAKFNQQSSTPLAGGPHSSSSSKHGATPSQMLKDQLMSRIARIGTPSRMANVFPVKKTLFSPVTGKRNYSANTPFDPSEGYHSHVTNGMSTMNTNNGTTTGTTTGDFNSEWEDEFDNHTGGSRLKGELHDTPVRSSLDCDLSPIKFDLNPKSLGMGPIKTKLFGSPAGQAVRRGSDPFILSTCVEDIEEVSNESSGLDHKPSLRANRSCEEDQSMRIDESMASIREWNSESNLSIRSTRAGRMSLLNRKPVMSQASHGSQDRSLYVTPTPLDTPIKGHPGRQSPNASTSVSYISFMETSSQQMNF